VNAVKLLPARGGVALRLMPGGRHLFTANPAPHSPSRRLIVMNSETATHNTATRILCLYADRAEAHQTGYDGGIALYIIRHNHYYVAGLDRVTRERKCRSRIV